jgi:hypothetical protein
MIAVHGSVLTRVPRIQAPRSGTRRAFAPIGRNELRAASSARERPAPTARRRPDRSRLRSGVEFHLQGIRNAAASEGVSDMVDMALDVAGDHERRLPDLVSWCVGPLRSVWNTNCTFAARPSSRLGIGEDNRPRYLGASEDDPDGQVVAAVYDWPLSLAAPAFLASATASNSLSATRCVGVRLLLVGNDPPRPGQQPIDGLPGSLFGTHAPPL